MLPHILVSFAVLPPVILATRSCSSSVFNSVSWLDKSALLLLLSSCALTCHSSTCQHFCLPDILSCSISSCWLRCNSHPTLPAHLAAGSIVVGAAHLSSSHCYRFLDVVVDCTSTARCDAMLASSLELRGWKIRKGRLTMIEQKIEAMQG